MPFAQGGGVLSGRGAVLPRGPPLYQWDFIFFVLRPLVQTLAHYVRMYGDTLVEAGKVHSDGGGAKESEPSGSMNTFANSPETA